MKKWTFVILMLMAFVVVSCVWHNTEDLYPNQNTTGCDTTTVTYTNQIKPFFDNKCTSCHYQGGTYPALDNYSDANAYAIIPGNLLYDKVLSNHKSCNPTECETAQVKKWVETGAAN